MPELPEVETIRSALDQRLVGLVIQHVVIRAKKLRHNLCLETAIPAACRIQAVMRRAKYLLIKADDGTWVIHLGMSGKLSLVPYDCPPTQHDHADWLLSNHVILRFNDPRRFGSIRWYTQDPLREPFFSRLGPEPLNSATPIAHYFKYAQTRSCTIKPLLMNQMFVAGIGNIYASEILFEARIHPAQIAHTISYKKWCWLIQAIRHVLGRAIEAGGSSIRDFASLNGQKGDFQVFHQVYGRFDQPCWRCGTPIKRLIQQARSSFYCPCCQVLPIE